VLCFCINVCIWLRFPLDNRLILAGNRNHAARTPFENIHDNLAVASDQPGIEVLGINSHAWLVYLVLFELGYAVCSPGRCSVADVGDSGAAVSNTWFLFLFPAPKNYVECTHEHADRGSGRSVVPRHLIPTFVRACCNKSVAIKIRGVAFPHYTLSVPLRDTSCGGQTLVPC